MTDGIERNAEEPSGSASRPPTVPVAPSQNATQPVTIALVDQPTSSAAVPKQTPADLTASEISALQQLLTRRGYDPGPVDGRLGVKTKSAIDRYVAERPLPQGRATMRQALISLTKGQ